MLCSPGYENDFWVWWTHQAYNILEAIYAGTLLFTFVSTILTIYATRVILQFVRTLSGSRRGLEFNRFAVVIHALVLMWEFCDQM